MSIMTKIQNFRAARKEQQEINNASESAAPKTRSWTPVLGVPFALAFMFMLVAIQPAAAVSINLTVISDVINSFIDLITPITNLVVAIVPLWFIMQILAFIMGLLAAILGMIKFGKMR